LHAGLGFWETLNRRRDPKDKRAKLEDSEDMIALPSLNKEAVKKLSALLPSAVRDGLPETQDGRYFLVDFDMIREVINSAPPKVSFHSF
jgi:hypothetical protein